jgi:hypothetical protein
MTTPMHVVESFAYRAPLAVHCVDVSTGVEVVDGLLVEAWPAGDPAGTRPARRSPVSALFGFATFPGLRAQEYVVTDGGAPVWPPPVALDVAVRVVDTAGRYLPQTLAVGAPFNSVLEVELCSAPARPPLPGWAAVTGEVHVPGPGSFAVVHVRSGTTTWRTVCDARGCFAAYLPYPEAPPALTGTPPLGTGLGTITWQLVVDVACQPSVLQRLADGAPADPPTTDSILAQSAAQIGGAANTTVTLTLGHPLVLSLDVTPA